MSRSLASRAVAPCRWKTAKSLPSTNGLGFASWSPEGQSQQLTRSFQRRGRQRAIAPSIGSRHLYSYIIAYTLRIAYI